MADVDGYAGAAPLEGGHSGETFVVSAAGERAVLRVYGRDPGRAVIDASLLRLVRGLVPVPSVLDVRPEEDGRAHLLTTFEPGVLLEQVLPGADADLRGRLADSVVDVLARLAGMPFVRPGEFADAGLTLTRTAAEEAQVHGLAEWAERQGVESRLAAWPRADLDALRAICLDADALLDTLDRTCLVHSDFNGKNLLVGPESGAVTALVDWEFAHAGAPVHDLGNLLRFEHGSAWEADVAARAGERMPLDRDDLLELARASDLWALIELAGRVGDNPVADRAHDLLRDLVRGSASS